MLEMKTIREERWVLAPFTTRSFAFAIDLALFLAMMALLGLIAVPIGNALWNLDGMLEQIITWQKDYGLLVFQEGSWVAATSVEAVAQEAYTTISSTLIASYVGYQNYLEIIKGLIAVAVTFLVPTLIFKEGKTIGKKLLKLRVITREGEPVRPVIMMFRVLIGMWAFEYVLSLFFSYVTVMLSLVLALLTKRQTALHDYIGRTMVVKDEKEFIEVELPLTPVGEDSMVPVESERIDVPAETQDEPR